MERFLENLRRLGRQEQARKALQQERERNMVSLSKQLQFEKQACKEVLGIIQARDLLASINQELLGRRGAIIYGDENATLLFSRRYEGAGHYLRAGAGYSLQAQRAQRHTSTYYNLNILAIGHEYPEGNGTNEKVVPNRSPMVNVVSFYYEPGIAQDNMNSILGLARDVVESKRGSHPTFEMPLHFNRLREDVEKVRSSLQEYLIGLFEKNSVFGIRR